MSDMLGGDQALKEFLVESHENLDALDREFLALESAPATPEQVASIFRVIHTVKGTAGFFGFTKLQALTHHGESLLSDIREGVLTLTQPMVGVLLVMSDRVRAMLQSIEADGTEGTQANEDVIGQLMMLKEQGDVRAPAPPPPPTVTLTPKVSPPRPAAVIAPEEPPAVVASPEPAKPEASVSAKSDEGSAGPVVDTSVRIDVGLLDRLMNQVGELVLARNQILQFCQATEDANFIGASQRLNLITTELQTNVMKTRMQPIGSVWNKLPRVVRDLAVTCGKQTRIELLGKETELDRTVLEAIKDPLTHIVRNAVDHGIEKPEVRAEAGKPRTGTLVLRAFHEGGQVNIEISDDGAGLKFEAVRAKAIVRGLVTEERARRMSESELCNLLFLPGFSTAETITNVSGRGVGMDVVKTNIERIGGTVDLSSVTGKGTRIRIKIPLTLAIVPALTVSSAGQHYAIPQVNLLELVRLEDETAIERVRGQPVYRLRGRLLPVVFLNEQIRHQAAATTTRQAVHMVVLQADDQQFGLIVDEIRDTEEIVVKPLGKELKSISIFAGATIMGDGRVALILDVIGLAQRAGVLGRAKSAASELALLTTNAQADGGPNAQALLLFAVGTSAQAMALPLALVDRLEEFPRKRLEQTGRGPVVQYRGEILPLLEPFDCREALGDDSVPVIVFARGRKRVGLVVGRILDVVEHSLVVDRESASQHVMGSAIIAGRVTELLDVESILGGTTMGATGAYS
jgi:two-component system chemotaxis sensor kinase CheA